MKVYELMSKLGKVDAGNEVKINVCLSLSELKSGEQIDNDLYCLGLNVYEVDMDTGDISTEL